MLTVTGLQKSYTDGERLVQVLRELSFSCARGRSLAVTGASGSGKSTLLNILAATLAPDAGSVVVADEQREFAVHAMNVAEGTRFRRRHVGYVHQFYNLIPTLTVRENVLLPLRLNKITDSDPHALMLLEQVGLSARLDVFPQSLSGGEQQRVAVVRALVLKPLLVLADEPTGNLDAENSARVRDLLFASAREVNAALVIATHSEDVAQRADARLRLELQTS